MLQQIQFTPPPPVGPAQPKMNEMVEKPLAQCSPEYLAQLMKDKTSFSMVSSMFCHVERLLDDEINRVRRSLYSIRSTSQPLMLPKAEGAIQQMSEKLFIPIKAYPDFNFIGRILGPRGMTAKQLEKETGCKIMIRGKSSMRDKVKEDMNRGKPNWEHLNEELHVLITVDDTKERAELKLKKASEEIKKLLVPTAEGEDELKKSQLVELALMKGTYRDNTNKLQANIAATPLTASPRALPAPAGALIPHPMRSPTPAAQAHQHLLAPQLLPRMAATTMVNGLGGIQASPAMMQSHDGSNILMPLDPFQQYAYTPAMLEYPPSISDGSLGIAPKLRRTIREHPYQRAVLDPRAAAGN